jgi:3-oxoacyl-[acyl-carrier protein] reductase
MTRPTLTGFEQTNAVVTGASSGIGRSTAIALAALGCPQMALHYRKNLQGVTQTARQVESYGTQVVLIAADLAITEDRIRLVDQAFEKLGRIDTWLHIAGGDVLTGQRSKSSFDDKLHYLWEVDVAGTIAVARDVTKRWQSQMEGPYPPSLVLTGWDQAPQGMEGDAGQMFGTIKAAVMAFANSLAQDVAPKIRVNVVAPGWVQTAWGENTDAYWNRRAQSQSLMQRWGRPEDIAAAMVYLANPGNTFVTGQTIEVNGGWNRRFDRGKESGL